MPILTLSSSRLKPLPARTFLWYLIVGHLTIGRMGPATGRGAMRRALAWRAFLLECRKGQRSGTQHFCQMCHSYMAKRPVLPSSICRMGSSQKQTQRRPGSSDRPVPDSTEQPQSSDIQGFKGIINAVQRFRRFLII